MTFTKYEVGKVNADLIGSEKVLFDISDSGAELFVTFSRPTQKEIQAFKEDITIKYVIVEGVIFLLFKFRK